ncbi:MAG: PTS sugar transporter subunit IIA [Verrucomicrobiales bacterium]|nr:PTS sugar transporter subunit IIA [Verrucomicrobiales bacterium]
MTLSELLTPERVIAEMQSEEHWPAIVELVDHLVKTSTLTTAQKEPALAALKAREEQSSTGIGGGIAIPHAKLPHLDEIVAVFGRSTPGVDFCAQDCAPVHYIVLFMVPEGQHGAHLKTLASIAKTLNSADTRKQLAGAGDAAEIHQILAQR